MIVIKLKGTTKISFIILLLFFFYIILLNPVKTFASGLENSDKMNPREEIIMENDKMGLIFDRNTGTLKGIQNKLAGENYNLDRDEFQIGATNFTLEFNEVTLKSLVIKSESLGVEYYSEGFTTEVIYSLHGNNHFAEKTITLSSVNDYELKDLIISQPIIWANKLQVVPYSYQNNMTYFGRTPKGGFFTGVEVPLDGSSINGIKSELSVRTAARNPFDASFKDNVQISLGYKPYLKVKANEKLRCEPIYFGVYKRYSGEEPVTSPPFIFHIRRYPGTPDLETIPLKSESEAMVKMTSTILGPPRHNLLPMACGWHCEMQHGTYKSNDDVEKEIQSLNFLAECGIDWLLDSHCWGGETEKMNSIVEGDKYEPGELVQKFLKHAEKIDIKVAMWSTMNHTHPWSKIGGAFRPDRPEWVMVQNGVPGCTRIPEINCFANEPFFKWLVDINKQGLNSGYYEGWTIDGSFLCGHGEYGKAAVHVNCASHQHSHLPGNSTYLCYRNLNRLFKIIRQQDPNILIMTCAPPMDQGIWSLKNVDACFTIDESNKLRLLEYLEGFEEQPVNVALGDKIRNWSRVRVHYHFFPHYIDLPLLFPTRQNPDEPPSWTSENLDYILLSALSCSPNQLYYLPTKTGIPDKDKEKIRRWFRWGRDNIHYLKFRKDLPQWPAAHKVDGSAHIVGNEGLIFLFNPNKNTLNGYFSITERCLGLNGKGIFRISQYYPESEKSIEVQYGDSIDWKVLGETSLILKIQAVE